MFFGRKFELEQLNKQFSSGHFEFPVIYGRRRVGKTELIVEFIKNKKAIYIQGVVGSPEQNLILIAKAVFEFRHQDITSEITYRSLEGALDDLTSIMEKEKMVIIFDEFPYLAESIPSAPSVFQYYIDQKWRQLDSMLILCGSSMSFIEKQVLSYKSPLYGRNITRYKLLPFSFEESYQFLKERGLKLAEDAVAYYGMTNAIPYYLSLIDPEKSVIENIRELFLLKNGKLLEEPIYLLNMEVTDPARYLAVLTSLGEGDRRLSEISNKTGMVNSNLLKYLDNLIELGIVEKEASILSPHKRSRYFIKDHLYHFWFVFISGNIGFIESGRYQVVERLIENQFSTYLGEIFEIICKEWLLKQSDEGSLPTLIREIGSWWGGNPQTKQQEEIDILAKGFKETEILIGECKWTNKLIDQSVINKLVERSHLFTHKDKYFYLFSKCGFTEEAMKKAEEEKIVLVEYSKMF